MKKDIRVIQAEEILNELEEPKFSKSSNLIGGFVTILIGCSVLREVTKGL